jgi:hypothetical protein
LARGLVSLNEAVHESALRRFGQTVKEARGAIVRDIVYEPRTLIALAGKPAGSHRLSSTGEAGDEDPA